MTLIRKDLESPPSARRFGSGWISGFLAITLGLVGLCGVLCLRYPEFLTVEAARTAYAQHAVLVRAALHAVLACAFILGVLGTILRPNKTVGIAALSLVLLASLLGGSMAESRTDGADAPFSVGLDWFILNLVFTGIVFIPLERLLKLREQDIFRPEWREDLFYFLVSSLMVQTLTFLSLAPALAILRHTSWTALREAVAGQPVALQVVEVMFLTDFVQYWVHRAFHRIPFLWNFHAVHHSAQHMDWLAGSRMHFMEIICLRGCTVVPMYILGFAPPALYAYFLFVYLFSTLIHSNVRLRLRWLQPWFVTPRFHHWHHGIEKEAIDVNFAIHFPLFDRLFGTYHLPRDGRWPSGYGIQEPLPKGFLGQFLHPFRRKPKPAAADAARNDGLPPDPASGPGPR